MVQNSRKILLPFFLFFLVSLVSEGSGATAEKRSVVGTNRFVKISEKLKPSVVNIILTRQSQPRKGRMRLLFDRFFGMKHANDFEDFASYILFHEYPQRNFTEKLVGSGIIVRPEGIILTNDHVVHQRGNLEVILSDNRSFPAKVIGRDYLTDLAVIKIEAEALPVVRFGDSEKLRTGEWVLAIGNSLGLHYTVSAGIVSATGRNLFEEDMRPYFNMIQTDAPINLGNSGGPLVNMKGEVVGVNTSIIPEGQSIGFAIPMNDAEEVLSELIHKGKVERGWLGVTLRGGKEESPLRIESVLPRSPAEKAGVHAGDHLLAFNGVTLKSPKELHEIISSMEIGSKGDLGVEREQKPLLLEVVIEEMPIPEFSAQKSYPSGVEGFILRLPARTRLLLITGALLFIVLLIKVQRDIDRKIGRLPHSRDKERRGRERRATVIPIEEIRVTQERRKAGRRSSERRHKHRWFTIG